VNVRAPKPTRKPRERLDEPPPDDGDTPSPGSAEEGDGEGRPDKAWRREMLRSSSGGWKDCRENVYLALTKHPDLKGLVGYDKFAHRVMKLKVPPWGGELGEWLTDDDYQLGFWLATKLHMTVKGEGTLVAGVAMAANANAYHPVLQYLDGLVPWDGTKRLASWMSDCLGAQADEYTALVGTWFLMGMVKRVMSPGCQMDYMIVLEGLQGKQKSTALRTLVGNDDWFADTPIRIGDKDALLSLAGKWLYEVGEMDAFNRAETTAVKQYVSSRIDRVREPFARRPCDRPRSGVFAGSTNQAEYFKDPTGARRFWPVACDGDIRLDLLAASRDQLFAEAMVRLASEDAEERRFWPTREETEKYLVPQQERREIVDPWFERLASWLESSDVYAESGHEIREVENFTSHELLVRALHVPTDRIDGGRQMATRVGIAMHKLGWEKRRDATGARLHRYWRPKKEQRPAQDASRVADSDATPGGVPEELLHD
jgi:predicted P-loop ATPase